MWNLKENDTNELIYKTNRLTDLWLPKEKGGRDKLGFWD